MEEQEKIQDASEIYRILRTVNDRQIKLRIHFKHTSTIYGSSLVSVDRSMQNVELDELMPAEGNSLIRQGAGFNVEAKSQGIWVTLPNCVYVQTLEDKAYTSHQLRFPGLLIYRQRRSAFRVRVARSLDATAIVFVAPHNEPLAGRLLDISATGLKCAIPGNHESTLVKGESYPQCLLKIPPSKAINFCALVMYCEYSPVLDDTICGLQFESFTGRGENQLSRNIVQLQRLGQRHRV